MRLTFYHYNNPVEPPYIEDFIQGAKEHGDVVAVCHADNFTQVPVDSDVALFVGIKGKTREIVDAYRAAGKRIVIFDKGAIRTRNRSTHRKIFLDGGTALAYLNRVPRRPSDRWKQLGIELAPFQLPEPGAPIIYANNSQKVHDYWGLGSAADLAEYVVETLHRLAPTRTIIFRPKPRALDFREIDNVVLSLKPDTIEDALCSSQYGRAHCLVTHASHCSVNALIAGIPVVALSPNPAKSLAGRYIEQALKPPVPTSAERLAFFENLAYTQWTPEEFQNGLMWDFIKREMSLTFPQKDEPIKPLRRVNG